MIKPATEEPGTLETQVHERKHKDEPQLSGPARVRMPPGLPGSCGKDAGVNVLRLPLTQEGRSDLRQDRSQWAPPATSLYSGYSAQRCGSRWVILGADALS